MGTTRRRRQLSLILPAFNEAAGIAEAIREAYEALRRLNLLFEIIVVDDGSQDGTAEIVRQVQIPRVRLISHSVNQGYGAALRTGFENARYEWVAFTDADRQFYLDDLDLLFQATEESFCRVAVGARADRQDPWQRKFYSRQYNRLVRFLLGTGVQDCDCALKLFHRDILYRLLPQTDGFFVNAEMLTYAREQQLKIAEVPVRHRPRMNGKSTVSLKHIPRTLRELLPFWWKHKVLKQDQQTVVMEYRVPGYATLRPLISQRLVDTGLSVSQRQAA